MNMHHQSRNYTYDNQPQAAHYPHEQSQVNPDGSYPSPVQGYPRASYDQQQAPEQYYYTTTPVAGQSSHVVQGDPYYRTMSPNAAAGHHRYHNTGVDPRYHSSQGTAAASSSQVSDPGYPAQTGYYATQYSSTHPRAHPPTQQSPSPQYIPSPSELHSAYPSYPHPPHPQSVSPVQPSRPVQSPAIPHSPTESYTSSDYPSPHHIVPSSSQASPHPSQAQKLSRISTNRLRATTSSNSQSPTSASSPPGERFPCEKCGKTFSRSHDRKRHHETQHLPCPVIHRCRYCEKEFSRADSLKRHLDNGCDEMP